MGGFTDLLAESPTDVAFIMEKKADPAERQ